MIDKRTKYTPEFKRGAVELTLLEGKTVKEVANDLEICPGLRERVAFGMSPGPVKRSLLLSRFQDIRLAYIDE